MTVVRQDVSFTSSGTRCAAWFFEAASDSVFAGPRGVPVVVMAHGLAGTMDSGLEPFAQRFADAGLAVLTFDYRGFGLSGGAARQRVSLSGQADDYRAAIIAAKQQPGVDADRVILWGVSQSGGNVFVVADGRDDICAVLSLVPMVNGIAAGRLAAQQRPATQLARSTVRGIGSAIAGRIGRSPTMVPVVGPPGSGSLLDADGYEEQYLALVGPSWRNELDASIALEVGGFRADRHAKNIAVPTLVQIADFDRGSPPHAAAKAAFAARAEVRHYPCDHFDVLPGNEWFDAAVMHEIGFLTRHLVGASSAAPAQRSSGMR